MKGMQMDDQTCLPFTRWCFKRRFLALLLLILAMLIIVPLADEFVRLRMLMDIFWSALFIAVIYAVSQKKHHILVGVLLALPMLGSIWSRYFMQYSALEAVGGLCGAAFFIFAIIQILIFVYTQKEVTRDLIAGAAIVYLLMALAWSFIFGAVESLNPGSFSIPDIEGISISRSFLYYSFVTITTLGYGDITPVTSLARSLCILEAVIGQLYLVVQVAWLVGVHVSQSMLKKSE
ncbi:MAG: hypothetical protein JSU80_02415 [Deltaproteobacteria bacterium]|nr:MAG: hypothetical protein JSU80_02415 [Deltaproteobacteria bacterium]